MNRLLIAASLVFLSGCAALETTETADGCTVTGAMLEAIRAEQPADREPLNFYYLWKDKKCTVQVWSGDKPPTVEEM